MSKGRDEAGEFKQGTILSCVRSATVMSSESLLLGQAGLPLDCVALIETSQKKRRWANFLCGFVKRKSGMVRWRG